MAELQKDPITRGDFLGFGLLGAISGAILTIPPVAFLLSPVIKTNILGQTDIDQGWQRVASVEDLKKLKPGTPDVFEVEFPIEQVYSDKEIQDKFPGSQKSESTFTVRAGGSRRSTSSCAPATAGSTTSTAGTSAGRRRAECIGIHRQKSGKTVPST